ncbi:MAG: tetratricopeptide repeat protein [Candidatus Gastranaerophilales bacterium]
MFNKRNKDRIILIIICFISIAFLGFVKLAPDYYYHLGKYNYENGNYEEARAFLRKSYFLKKDDIDVRYYYAKTLTELKSNIDVQMELYSIAMDSVDDAASVVAQQKIDSWQNNINNNIGSNYIGQTANDNGVIRWDISEFPLNVFISNEYGDNLPGYFNNEIKKSLFVWKNSTNFLDFSIVNNAIEADIEVFIKPLPDDVCENNICRYVVGYTRPTIKSNLLKKMTIILYATNPQGQFVPAKQLYNTVLHELGHAFGIMGHSYNSDDIMYMAADNNDFHIKHKNATLYLSQRDLNTIKLLYQLTPTISNTNNKNSGKIYAPIVLGSSQEVSERKLKEARNYIKNAPDLAGGYVDLAVAYAELGKSKEAIKSLNKALQLAKTTEENFTILYNLATIYYNTKNYAEALNFANKAQKYINNDDVKNLILNIKNGLN